jgi:hydroxymethylpyrimidine kinase/phosphomethylpyrimidine kinase
MVSTSGAQLLPQVAVKELRTRLLPMTTVLTPNVPEAKLLLSDAGQEMKEPQCIDDLVSIAKAVQALGSKYVLVKGGHVPFKNDGKVAWGEADRELVVDVLYGNGEVLRIDSAYQQSRNTHGTGCSLACE